MRANLAMKTDSYKVTHHLQYPKGTEHVYSYFESRHESMPVMFFGLQYWLQEYLTKQVTKADVEYAATRWAKHFGTDRLFNYEGWMRIVEVHNGYIPLSIKAVLEGTVMNPSNVMVTVENTDPNLPWLTNWFETLLSQVWYSCSVATRSWQMKRLINGYLVKTGTPDLVSFKLHDFGFRGVSSPESAGIGGMAHLVNFMGTDTSEGFEYATEYYGADMAGFSIPAAEHSTITSWGKENEVEAFRNMIQQFGEGAPGLYAIVIDSYDTIDACINKLGTVLKGDILKAGNTLVARPDSGIPHEIVPRVLKCLAEKFGVDQNEKGYWVLNPKVRVIQGDGISVEETGKILFAMEQQGWSADNVAFGMGAELLQKLNRDTHKFAFKCSHVSGKDEQGNPWSREVFKEPVTDMGKRSKRGKLRLLREGKTFKTVRANEWVEGEDQLVEVFRDGKLLVKQSFEDIRARAAASI